MLLPTEALHMLIHELERINWDVIGVCETYWTGMHEFHVKEYKIISVGKEDCHRSGVALILMKHAQWVLVSYNPVNDVTLSARFQTATGFVSICQVYAPTPTTNATIEALNTFYDALQHELCRIPTRDYVIVLGDFNSKDGKGDQSTKGILGPYGIGERNSNGDR